MVKTLLVLGAGASKPYGFPTGGDLREEICSAVETDNLRINERLEKILQLPRPTIKEFADAFLSSGVDSIDAFLDRRPEFDEIGRTCIAFRLIEREIPSMVLKSVNREDWYRRLWNNLIGDKREVSLVPFESLRVFTFNYDRSLEYFLYSALSNTFGLKETEALQQLSRIEIQHAYGELGKFSTTEPSAGGRTFTNYSTSQAITTAAESLTIIQRTAPEDAVFQTARSWFDWSQETYFLGFGFDELNCKRLNFPSVLNSVRSDGKEGPAMFATSLGMSPLELDRAIARIDPKSRRITTMQKNCMEAIAHWPIGAR